MFSNTIDNVIKIKTSMKSIEIIKEYEENQRNG